MDAVARSNRGGSPPDAPGTVTQPFGTFCFDVATGRLTWSDGMYALYGFGPGEIVPSLELLAFHQHPDDLDAWRVAIEGTLADGRSLCVLHRIHDTGGRLRYLLTTAAGQFDGNRMSEVSGVVVDLTPLLRENQQAEVARAVLRSTASRSVIEQAKGVLMAIFEIDEKQAFDLLRWHSSYSNVKLRDVATILLTRLSDTDLANLPPRRRLTTILTGLTSQSRPTFTAPERAGSAVEPALDRALRTMATARAIPAADLSRTMLRAVAGAAHSVTVSDCRSPSMPLVYANAAFLDLTGYPAEEILGHNCRFLQGPETDPVQVAAVGAAIAEGREVRTVLRNYRRDGSAFWNELHLSAVRDDDGRLTHYIGYQTDVSERVEREQQLMHLAYHDARTGLPNTLYAMRHLEQSIRTAGAAGLTVLQVHVGGFRSADSVNDSDTVGSVLTATRERLLSVLPADAFLAKLDDDVFLVVHAQQNGSVAAAIVEQFSRPMTAAGGTVVTIRIGQASSPQDGTDLPALLARSADVN